VKGEMTSPFFETIKIAGDIQVRQTGSTFEATVEVGKDVYDLTVCMRCKCFKVDS